MYCFQVRFLALDKKYKKLYTMPVDALCRAINNDCETFTILYNKFCML